MNRFFFSRKKVGLFTLQVESLTFLPLLVANKPMFAEFLQALEHAPVTNVSDRCDERCTDNFMVFHAHFNGCQHSEVIRLQITEQRYVQPTHRSLRGTQLKNEQDSSVKIYWILQSFIQFSQWVMKKNSLCSIEKECLHLIETLSGDDVKTKLSSQTSQAHTQK